MQAISPSGGAAVVTTTPPQYHRNNTPAATADQHLCHGRVFSTHGPCRDHHSCHLYSSVAAAVEHSQIISDSLLYFQIHLNYIIIDYFHVADFF